MFIVRDTTIVNIIIIYYNSFPPRVCTIMSFVLYSCKLEHELGGIIICVSDARLIYDGQSVACSHIILLYIILCRNCCRSCWHNMCIVPIGIRLLPILYTVITIIYNSTVVLFLILAANKLALCNAATIII